MKLSLLRSLESNESFGDLARTAVLDIVEGRGQTSAALTKCVDSIKAIVMAGKGLKGRVYNHLTWLAKKHGGVDPPILMEMLLWIALELINLILLQRGEGDLEQGKEFLLAWSDLVQYAEISRALGV